MSLHTRLVISALCVALVSVGGATSYTYAIQGAAPQGYSAPNTICAGCKKNGCDQTCFGTTPEGYPATGVCIDNSQCLTLQVGAFSPTGEAGLLGIDGLTLQDAVGFLGLIQSLGGTVLGGGTPSGGSFNPYTYEACVMNPITNEVSSASKFPCKRPDGSIAYSPGPLVSSLGDGTAGGNPTPGIGSTLLDLLGGNSLNIGGSSATKTTPVSSSLLDILGTSHSPSSQVPVSQQIGQGLTPGGQGTPADKTTTSPFSNPKATSSVKLVPGATGNIRVSESGATVIAEGIDASGSGVAGFYGAGSGSLLQSRSIVGKLCASRPWQSGFLAAIVSPSFFDGICEWGGYNAAPVVPDTRPRTQTFQQPVAAKPTSTPAVPTIRPEVDIWADPPSVRLGTRTYIYWNSRGVASCEARGPSFEERSLSGGASTVPLSDASVFTIQCTTADGSVTVEDRVTVYLAI